MSKNNVKAIKEKEAIHHKKCQEALSRIDMLLRREISRCQHIENQLKELKSTPLGD